MAGRQAVAVEGPPRLGLCHVLEPYPGLQIRLLHHAQTPRRREPARQVVEQARGVGQRLAPPVVVGDRIVAALGGPDDLEDNSPGADLGSCPGLAGEAKDAVGVAEGALERRVVPGRDLGVLVAQGQSRERREVSRVEGSQAMGQGFRHDSLLWLVCDILIMDEPARLSSWGGGAHSPHGTSVTGAARNKPEKTVDRRRPGTMGL